MSANKAKHAAGFVVLLADNGEENRKKLAEMAKAGSLTIPLTIALEGAEGPADYKLNADVPTTVILSRRDMVMANFALSPKDEAAQKADVDRILARAAKLLR